MDMDIFAQEVCAAVGRELGEGYRVETREVSKTNGVLLRGLMILSDSQNVVPTIYLEGFLDAYESGMPFEDVISGLLSLYRRDKPEGGIAMDFFLSYEKVRDRICYRLMGRKGNESLLEGIPHVEYLDMAVCFYYAYHDEELGEGAILIHNSHMKNWDVCTGELFRRAQANTPRLFHWSCRTIDEVLCGLLGQDENEISGLLGGAWKNPMRVLGNDKGMLGAACILYPHVLEEIAAGMNRNLYIIPSSVHETLILPGDGGWPPEELKRMIMEVNRTQVAPEDVLSDSLYYYDAVRKEVVVL